MCSQVKRWESSLEVSAKPLAKDSALSKRWGGFVSAEQGGVPGAALLMPIGYQWSRLLRLLGTKVHPALLGTEQEHRAEESHSRLVFPPNTHGWFGAGCQNHPSYFTFFLLVFAIIL